MREALRQRRDEIVGRWFDEVMGTYPDGGERFRADRDAFRNPVGTTVRRELPILFDGVVGDADADATVAALEALVRLRSVQGFAPSEAVGFVFNLKRLIRETAATGAAGGDAAEALAIEQRIDALGLEAFDLFVGWREKLFELRVREAKAHVHSLLRRAGMLVEDGEAPEEATPGRGEKGGREA